MSCAHLDWVPWGLVLDNYEPHLALICFQLKGLFSFACAHRDCVASRPDQWDVFRYLDVLTKTCLRINYTYNQNVNGENSLIKKKNIVYQIENANDEKFTREQNRTVISFPAETMAEKRLWFASSTLYFSLRSRNQNTTGKTKRDFALLMEFLKLARS